MRACPKHRGPTIQQLSHSYDGTFDGVVEQPGNIPLYLDNLERLKLICEKQFSIDVNKVGEIFFPGKKLGSNCAA